MYDDVESDFWKEIFVHLLHKNMVRVNASPLKMEQCKAVFEEFEKNHPDCKPDVSFSSSYVTWELFVSQSIKLRLFIQNQIKASIMQKDGNDYVKVCDAKFPNNPFPEIEEFVQNRQKYLKELEEKKGLNQRTQMQDKILYEFIKAHLIRKFKNDKETVWSLEIKNRDFILHLQKDKEIKDFVLSCDNYKKIIFEL